MVKKLIQDVFDYPDCPSLAKYAAVDSDGYAYYYDKKPYAEVQSDGTGDWIQTGNTMQFISDNFDGTDWEYAIIEKEK